MILTVLYPRCEWSAPFPLKSVRYRCADQLELMLAHFWLWCHTLQNETDVPNNHLNSHWKLIEPWSVRGLLKKRYSTFLYLRPFFFSTVTSKGVIFLDLSMIPLCRLSWFFLLVWRWYHLQGSHITSEDLVYVCQWLEEKITVAHNPLIAIISCWIISDVIFRGFVPL